VEHVERLCRSASIRSRSRAAPRACTTWPAPPRSTAAPSTTPWPAALQPQLITELEGLANRGYTGGLLERRPANDYQNYETGHSVLQRSHFVGEVRGYADGWPRWKPRTASPWATI
jgi:putative protease